MEPIFLCSGLDLTAAKVMAFSMHARMQEFVGSVLRPISMESKTTAISGLAIAFAERFLELRGQVGQSTHFCMAESSAHP